MPPATPSEATCFVKSLFGVALSERPDQTVPTPAAAGPPRGAVEQAPLLSCRTVAAKCSPIPPLPGC
jgi:hypothetical protein